MVPTEAEAVALQHVVALTVGRVEPIVEGVVGQQDLLMFDPDCAGGGQVKVEGGEAGIDGNGIGALGAGEGPPVEVRGGAVGTLNAQETWEALVEGLNGGDGHASLGEVIDVEKFPEVAGGVLGGVDGVLKQKG